MGQKILVFLFLSWLLVSGWSSWYHFINTVDFQQIEVCYRYVVNFILSILLVSRCYGTVGLSRWCSGKESACQCRRCKRHRLDPWVRKIPWSRKWQPAPVCLPGKFHGQRSLAHYSLRDCERIRQKWALRASMIKCLKLKKKVVTFYLSSYTKIWYFEKVNVKPK